MNSQPTASLKAIATDFLKRCATKDVRAAYREHVSPDFRHHNAYFKADAETLMLAMEENALRNPNKTLEIQRSLVDGDLVAIHSKVHLQPGDGGMSLVHIFKFKDNKIVELWDIGQAVPANSPNEFGMF